MYVIRKCIKLMYFRDREFAGSDLMTKVVINKNKYGEVFYLLGEIFKLLRLRSTCNKRELYYKNVEFFRSYEKFNTVVTTVYNLLGGAAPWELGIVSSSKSLIAGPLRIGNAEGNIIDFSESTPLPNDFYYYQVRIQLLTFPIE